MRPRHPAATGRAPSAASPGQKWPILATVLLGATMSALDVSIVNVALPTMKRTFEVSMGVIEWVSVAYMLALTIFLPLFGRLADRFGRGRLYTVGFVVFSLGSLLCGVSVSAPMLIASRIVQAVGAGLLLEVAAEPGSAVGRARGSEVGRGGDGAGLREPAATDAVPPRAGARGDVRRGRAAGAAGASRRGGGGVGAAAGRAALQTRSFGSDVWRCPCGGHRRVLAIVSSPNTAQAVLQRLGLLEPRRAFRSHGPAPPQLSLPL